MIIILRSNVNNGDVPYQFTNYFNENFSIKPNSILELKQVSLNRAEESITLANNARFLFIPNDPQAPQVDYTIPAGTYSLQNLVETMNNLCQTDLLQLMGYSTSFQVTTIEQQPRIKWNVFSYINPAIPNVPYNQYQVQWNSTYGRLVNTQAVGNVLSKSIGTVDINDNYALYKQAISSSTVPANDPILPWLAGVVQPVAYPVPAGGFVTIVMDNIPPTSLRRVALVDAGFDGTEAAMRQYCCCEIQGNNNAVHIFENGVQIYPGPGGGVGRQLAQGEFLQIWIPQLLNGARPEDQRFFYKRNGRQGINPPAGVVRGNIPNQKLYLCVQFQDNTNSLSNARITVNPPNISSTALRYTQPTFADTSLVTVSSNASNNNVTITSDGVLAGLGGYAKSSNLKDYHDTGFSMPWTMGQTDKEVWVGFSNKTTSDWVTGDLEFALQFSNTGVLTAYEDGTPHVVANPAYNTNDWYRILMDDDFIYYQSSADSGTTWTTEYSSDNLFKQIQNYPVVLFPSLANSTNASLTFQHRDQDLNGKLGDVGKYLQFQPLDLKDTLGFAQDSYTFDFETSGNFPASITSEYAPEILKEAESYLIKLENLPIKSYNGYTHKCERIIGVMERELDQYTNQDHTQGSSFNTQRVELHNSEELNLNQIQVRVTNPDGSNPKDLDLTKDTNLVLEILPRVR